MADADREYPAALEPRNHPETRRRGLLNQRRFAPFFWTQFAGAMNDNVFKVGFSSLLTYQAARFGEGDPQAAAFLISAVYIFPFLIFSASAGQIADKWEKAKLIRWIKNCEIGIMALAGAGFLSHQLWLLYVCVFLMGLHSTVFGPVKYAYLPEQLSSQELLAGNGLVEGGTFVAILLGTIVGGAAAAIDGPLASIALLAAVLILAVLGRVAARRVPSAPASDPILRINYNPFSETVRNLRLAMQSRSLMAGLLGISWLWFVGAVFLASFFSYAKNVLGADASVVTVLLAVFSIGIGVGSVLCEYLVTPQLALALVPVGGIGMSVFIFDLYLASPHAPFVTLLSLGAFLSIPAHWRILADLFLLALAGGLYSVPLYASIQQLSDPRARARVIAANNVLNALFMVAASLLALGLTAAGASLPQLYLLVGGLGIVFVIALCWIDRTLGNVFVSWLGTYRRGRRPR